MATLKGFQFFDLGRALIAVLLSAVSLSALAQTPVLEFKEQDGITRFSIESSAGTLIDAVLSDRGKELSLRFVPSAKKSLSSQLQQLTPGKLVKSVRLLPEVMGEGSDARVLIEFDRPVLMLDQTVIAMPNQISRWEVVLSDSEKVVPTAVPKPDLTSIEAVVRHGRVDLMLAGSLGLVAEANLIDAPAKLVVSLPGISRGQALDVANAFSSDTKLIRSLQVTSSPDGTTQLEFELTQRADLIDTQGLAIGAEGRVVLSLVPDTPADAGMLGQLNSLGIEFGSDYIQMRLVGIAQATLNAYTIEEPSRLVVDFLGWSPDQVRAALSKLAPDSAVLLGRPRLDVTRLGSARAVFDLAVPAPLQNARALQLPVDGSSGAFVENFLISLAPGASISQTLAKRNPLDPRFRRELMENRQTEVVVRPLTLSGAERYAASAVSPQRSTQIGLMRLFQKALESDAKYRSAQAEFAAVSEALPQARADYQPTASFEYQLSAIRQDINRAANAAFPTGETRYRNTNMALTITQPIFKPQAWIKMGQAGLLVDQARLNLVSAEQDLILRVAVAYLSVLAANDGVELARAERLAVEKQFDEAKTRLESGLGTISQKQDTEARLSLTRAREIEADNRAEDARLALKEIIGENIADVRGFRNDFNASMPLPSAADAWVQASLEQNLALQSRNLAVEIASMEIRRQQAGHLPTLSLTAGVVGQDASGSIYGQGQRSDEANVGIRLSVPLTSGGLVSSLTREAIARKDKAHQEREQEYRRTERLTRSSFNGVVTSAKTLDAMRQSVVAQESALRTRLEGYYSGLFNVVAVMDAYRLYYAAQRDFLQARYDYLGNRLKLRQAVGTLSRTDLEDIAALLD
ncbi:MAG: hypothetical protein RLZZ192_1705 [Pseudomonadota bacterium]